MTPIPWRAAAKTFEQILRKHGIENKTVTDVEDAWRAYVEFNGAGVPGATTASSCR